VPPVDASSYLEDCGTRAYIAWMLFHDGEVGASIRKLKPPKDNGEWGSTGKEADYLSKLRKLLAKMEPGDQKVLLYMAQKVARD